MNRYYGQLLTLFFLIAGLNSSTAFADERPVSDEKNQKTVEVFIDDEMHTIVLLPSKKTPAFAEVMIDGEQHQIPLLETKKSTN